MDVGSAVVFMFSHSWRRWRLILLFGVGASGVEVYGFGSRSWGVGDKWIGGGRGLAV